MMIAALLLAAACVPDPICPKEGSVPLVAPSLIQSAGIDRSSSASPTLAFPSPNTDGNLILVGVRAGSHTGHVLGVTDTLGNSYRLLGTVNGGTNSTHALFVAQNVKAGANTVTITDSTSYGGVRIAIREYANATIATGDAVATSGTGTVVPLDGAFSSVVPVNIISMVTPTPTTVPVEFVNGRLAMLDGADTLSFSSSTAWTAFSVALAPGGGQQGPCETPTPMIAWDEVVHPDLAGYKLYYHLEGGVPNLLYDIPCTWDERDGVMVRTCIGPDLWLALQRSGDFVPFVQHYFYLKAYTSLGQVSETFSDPLPICFRPLCEPPRECN